MELKAAERSLRHQAACARYHREGTIGNAPPGSAAVLVLPFRQVRSIKENDCIRGRLAGVARIDDARLRLPDLGELRIARFLLRANATARQQKEEHKSAAHGVSVSGR